MNTKQFTTDMLTNGDSFVVVGKTNYPRLTRVLEGEELAEEIKRATQQGRIPVTTPHCYTTLVDAYIEFADPTQPTSAELYAQERLFQNKDGRVCFSAYRKNASLPNFGIIDPANPSNVTQIYLDSHKNLANDILVKCYFRIFDGKAGMHKGVSLDTVVFQEPVKYYEFDNSKEQLAGRGLVWNPTEPPVQQNPVEPAYAQNAQAMNQNNMGQNNFSATAMNPPQTSMPTPQTPYAGQNQMPQMQNVNQQNQQNPQAGAPMYGGVQNGYQQPMNQTPVQNMPNGQQFQQQQNAQPAQPQMNGAQQMPQNAYGAQPQASQQNMYQNPGVQNDPYAGNQPQQTIGNAGGSAFGNSNVYDY